MSKGIWRWLVWCRLRSLRRFLGWGIWYLHYVGGTQALPPPLTSQEEEALLESLRRGDVSVRAQLIERNLRLVVYIARKFDNTRTSTEDLISIGTIGLIKAVNTFDVSRNIKLATYASKCIENEILMFLRRNSRRQSEISFDEPLNVDWDGNELLLSDVLGTEDDMIYKRIEKKVDRALLRKAIRTLEQRERQIVQMRYGLKDGVGKTQKQVADALGISQSYISRLEKRIIGRLRQEIKSME